MLSFIGIARLNFLQVLTYNTISRLLTLCCLSVFAVKGINRALLRMMTQERHCEAGFRTDMEKASETKRNKDKVSCQLACALISKNALGRVVIGHERHVTENRSSWLLFQR